MEAMRIKRMVVDSSREGRFLEEEKMVVEKEEEEEEEKEEKKCSNCQEEIRVGLGKRVRWWICQACGGECEWGAHARIETWFGYEQGVTYWKRWERRKK